MIVMLNGAFGVGKTTLANALLARHPEWMLFDPEEVGAMLWRILTEPRGDFQEIPAWPPLVVETTRVLVATYGKSLVVPMTLVDPHNFATVKAGFETIAPTHHFALVASAETIAKRLRERGSDTWAHEQTARCVTALSRPEFETHLDAERSVETLLEEVGAHLPKR